MRVKFKEWKCITETGYYDKGNNKALTLIEVGTGEPVITASVNLIDAKLTSDKHIFIKDYSENDGAVVALIEAGVIERDVTNTFYNGFAVINEYKLTNKALKLWKKQKS